MHRLRARRRTPSRICCARRSTSPARVFVAWPVRTSPGVTEYEVEAELAHEFTRNRAKFAYNPIIASGANPNVLHYLTNDQTCKKGELLLLDVAASYANYNADLTRTIPVSGRFTRRQKQVYNAVLRVMRASIEARWSASCTATGSANRRQ